MRYREGRFFPDGKSLLALSDRERRSRVLEGPGQRRRRRHAADDRRTVLRWDGIPSPDGTHIAHFDKDQQLWVYDIEHEDGT